MPDDLALQRMTTERDEWRAVAEPMRLEVRRLLDQYAAHREALSSLHERNNENCAAKDLLRTAVRRALDELGVPSADYPAPVANAVAILTAALQETEDA